MYLKILLTLDEHRNGLRMREILYYVKADRGAMISALAELERLGYIYAERFSDPANMEYYNIWHIRG